MDFEQKGFRSCGLSIKLLLMKWTFDRKVFNELDSINLFSIIWYGAKPLNELILNICPVMGFSGKQKFS
jgi:hypothetical protein